MEWIVVDEEKGNIKLVSKKGTNGLIPKGTYLTIEDDKNKYILRVIESIQKSVYSPSPLLIDMDILPLVHDRKSQNIIWAHRVKDLFDRKDGLIDFIELLSIARLSNQEEISLALESKNNSGPNVMLATIHSSRCQVLRDNNINPIVVSLPKSMFYHQIQICGKTGSGKTVASKWLADYFINNLGGAVLAINVKDDDFLRMDKASIIVNETILDEWKALGVEPKGIGNFSIYYPATSTMENVKGVTRELCKPITLDIASIEPEALSGLIRGLSDVGSENLPNIFRYWKHQQDLAGIKPTFNNFISYFRNAEDDGRFFNTRNIRGDESAGIKLHSGTYNNILRNLDKASEFFDSKDAVVLDASSILNRGEMSVINVAGSKNVEFGAILLRHLLHDIVAVKQSRQNDVPILIIIDEVHQFYNNNSSKEMLGDLDTICRTGRSQEIGVIFSSQNPTDIPAGLSSVINSKFIFNTDVTGNIPGIPFNKDELSNMEAGYAAVSIHGLPQVKSIKIPMSICGVFEKA